MEKIKSIFVIFIIFLFTTMASFAILFRYSTTALKDSLMRVARMQMVYTSAQLNQKIKEIEIEAEGILHSEDLKTLHLTLMEAYDAWQYVTDANRMKDYLKSRQKSNVGMAEFILYWPASGRIISTLNIEGVEEQALELAEDDLWFLYMGEVYYSRKYVTDWDRHDDEPYLLIRMERDYLYKIKNMASGVSNGGAMLTFSGGESLFYVNEAEQALLKTVKEQTFPQKMEEQKKQTGRQTEKSGPQMKETGRQTEEMAYEVSIAQGKYQLVTAAPAPNGLQLITYYPLKEMLKPVKAVTWVTGMLLLLLIGIGLTFLILYYRNILLQIRILTGKLMQVEEGDFDAQISAVEMPQNEFSYVFAQFNRMVMRIRQLIASILKEQQLRDQAELRQLQLQINPHFLSNSLSYIVTVADKPEAVTQMAMHLANYYRYCTQNKSMATVGEEVSYTRAYLSVMAMRRDVEYTIDVSEALYGVRLIPLLLQPLIENAVNHAIEERENAKHIYVKIYRLQSAEIHFEVSDDGNGMTEEQIGELMNRLADRQRDEEWGVGLWNVNQRLVNYYGAAAGLRFGKSVWGGLLVSFTILPEEEV
ncbi:histidine kinase [Eisenbergiella sp.]